MGRRSGWFGASRPFVVVAGTILGVALILAAASCGSKEELPPQKEQVSTTPPTPAPVGAAEPQDSATPEAQPPEAVERLEAEVTVPAEPEPAPAELAEEPKTQADEGLSEPSPAAPADEEEPLPPIREPQPAIDAGTASPEEAAQDEPTSASPSEAEASESATGAAVTREKSSSEALPEPQLLAKSAGRDETTPVSGPAVKRESPSETLAELQRRAKSISRDEHAALPAPIAPEVSDSVAAVTEEEPASEGLPEPQVLAKSVSHDKPAPLPVRATPEAEGVTAARQAMEAAKAYADSLDAVLWAEESYQEGLDAEASAKEPASDEETILALQEGQEAYRQAAAAVHARLKSIDALKAQAGKARAEAASAGGEGLAPEAFRQAETQWDAAEEARGDLKSAEEAYRLASLSFRKAIEVVEEKRRASGESEAARLAANKARLAVADDVRRLAHEMVAAADDAWLAAEEVREDSTKAVPLYDKARAGYAEALRQATRQRRKDAWAKLRDAGITVSATGDAAFATIGEAIAHAGANSAIFIKPGVYRERLVIDKPVVLVGEGDAGQVIVEVSGRDCLVMRAREALVHGLTIRATTGPENQMVHAVYIVSGMPVFESCDINSNSLTCVAVRGKGTDAVFRDCTFRGSTEAGIIVYDEARSTIEDCTIADNDDAGVQVKPNSSVVVRRCAINQNGRQAIEVYPGAAATVEDCDLTNNAAGPWRVAAAARVERRDNKE